MLILSLSSVLYELSVLSLSPSSWRRPCWSIILSLFQMDLGLFFTLINFVWSRLLRMKPSIDALRFAFGCIKYSRHRLFFTSEQSSETSLTSIQLVSIHVISCIDFLSTIREKNPKCQRIFMPLIPFTSSLSNDFSSKCLYAPQITLKQTLIDLRIQRYNVLYNVSH